MNTVVTYFEETELPVAEQRRLLEVWTQGWWALGWVPRVLTRAHAEQHPAWGEFSKAFLGYPTFNGRRYEAACWARWCAYSVVAREINAPILATDFDLLNVGGLDSTFGAPSRGRLLALHSVPTVAVVGDQRAFDGFVMAATREAERGIVRVEGKMHVSDMTLAQAIPGMWSWQILSQEWFPGAVGPLVHVSHAAAARWGRTKVEVVESEYAQKVVATSGAESQ